MTGGRHDETGENKDTASERRRARMYWQALIDEVSTAEDVATVTYEDWVKANADAGGDVMTAAIGKLCTHLLQKVEAKEQWTNLPADAHRGSVRDIKHSICHIMSMTLRRDLNAAADGGWKRLEGSVYDNDAFSKAETILKARYGAGKAACGAEARQRSDNELFDYEQMNLIESILGGKVAQQQRERGLSDRAARKPIDTLSLGVVNQLHFALGQRGVNVRSPQPGGLHAVCPLVDPPLTAQPVCSCAWQLDHCLWGYLRVSRFNAGAIWEGVKPSKLEVKSDAKGSSVGAAKHKAAVLHNRDPMVRFERSDGARLALPRTLSRAPHPHARPWMAAVPRGHARPVLCVHLPGREEDRATVLRELA